MIIIFFFQYKIPVIAKAALGMSFDLQVSASRD